MEKRLQDLEKKSREELEEAKEREKGIRTRVKERDDQMSNRLQSLAEGLSGK